MKRALLLLLAALAACGASRKETSAPPPDDPPAAAPDAGAPAAGEIPERLRTEAEAAIAFLGELSAAAATVTPETEADCDAMEAAMRPIAAGPNGQAIHTIDQDPDFQEHALAISKAYGTPLDEASDRLAASIGICLYHPGVGQILVEVGVVQVE